MQPGQAATVPGYRLRIVDGNHLPASDKRIKPLRDFLGAALPGQSLVVYDPDLGMVVDLMPGEDAHANERTLMEPLLAHAQPSELWIADRNFSTRNIITGWQHRGCGFIVREHSSSPKPQEQGALCRAGRIATGDVYEQPVAMDDDGHELLLRRVELHLNSPTEDGETAIRILTNLPKSAFTARKIARLYRRRWNIETLFQRLESVLCSEVTSLGHPRAAVKAKHDLQASDIELSSYYLATEVKAHYAGMMVAIAMAAWDAFDALPTPELAATVLQIAEKMDPRAMRKHPRGPKKPKKEGYVDGAIARRHVATARILKGELID